MRTDPGLAADGGASLDSGGRIDGRGGVDCCVRVDAGAMDPVAVGGGHTNAALVVPPAGLVCVAGDVIALDDLAGGEEVAAGAGFELFESCSVIGDVCVESLASAVVVLPQLQVSECFADGELFA